MCILVFPGGWGSGMGRYPFVVPVLGDLLRVVAEVQEGVGARCIYRHVPARGDTRPPVLAEVVGKGAAAVKLAASAGVIGRSGAWRAVGANCPADCVFELGLGLLDLVNPFGWPSWRAWCA